MSIDLYRDPTYQELQGSLGCHGAAENLVKEEIMTFVIAC